MENEELIKQYRFILLEYISHRSEDQEKEHEELFLEHVIAEKDFEKLLPLLMEKGYVIENGRLETFDKLQSASRLVMPMYFPNFKTTDKGVEALNTVFAIKISNKGKPTNWNKVGAIAGIIAILIAIGIAILQYYNR